MLVPLAGPRVMAPYDHGCRYLARYKMEILMDLGVSGQHYTSRLDSPWNGHDVLVPSLRAA